MCTRATLRHVGSAFVVTACAAAAAQDCDPSWSEAFGLRKLSGGSVTSLLACDDGNGPTLYASGMFESDGEQTLNGIARLTGNRWAGVGLGLNAGADDMVYVEAAPLGPALYVCGYSVLAGPVTISGIARWDGSAWSALGEVQLAIPLALAVFDDGSGPALYAGGIGGGPEGEAIVMRWDGTSWSEVGSFIGFVGDLVVFDDGSGPALFVAGSFDNVGGLPASNIARWDGSAWSALEDGVGGGIGGAYIWRMAAVVNGGPGVASGLYVGGGFDMAGEVAARGIARWDGRNWSALDLGAGGDVLALGVHDDGSGSGLALYAAGDFTQASGDPEAVKLGKWDGAAWSGVGGGVDGGLVRALESFDDGTGPGLYAGGFFSHVGEVAARYIARWDGQSWAPVATGGVEDYSIFPGVWALVPEPGGRGLVAGGQFSSAAMTAAQSVALLGPEGWSALGEGVDGFVRALAFFDDGTGLALVAGGGFDHAGGEPAASIARWDGAAWSPLGGGIDGHVFALEVFDDGSGNALYAGGRFAHAGGAPAHDIARWDGESWSDVGGDAVVEALRDTAIRALAVHDDGSGPAFYAGGDFDRSGSNPLAVRRWDGKVWSWVGDIAGVVWAFAVFDDGTGPALFAGGALSLPDDVGTSVARWDGESWSVVPDAPGATLGALEVVHDGPGGRPALYAGGKSFPDGQAIMARWDGSGWTSLGLGSHPEGSALVYAIAAVADLDGQGPSVFAGGDFTSLHFERAPGQGLEEISSGRIGRWLLCPPPAGDLDGDGAIGVADLELLLDAWGPCALPCPPTCAGDVDHDCTVGVTDLLMLLAEWAP